MAPQSPAEASKETSCSKHHSDGSAVLPLTLKTASAGYQAMCHFFFDSIVTHPRMRYVLLGAPTQWRILRASATSIAWFNRNIQIFKLARRRLDYYFRFDTDTRITAPVKTDVFDHMGALASGVARCVRDTYALASLRSAGPCAHDEWVAHLCVPQKSL
jgi:hypothetical protein